MHRKPPFPISRYLAILLSALLVACAQETPPEPEPEQKVLLKGNNTVLVRVNGEPITRYDLDQTIRVTLGNYSAKRLDEAGRQKVLESLVATRAIAQAQEADLSPEDQAVLDKKLRAYQEQLLVKQYLAQHAAPQPVTGAMVREYYQAHLQRFGAKTIRTYEMLASRRKLKAEERDALIQVLKGAAEKKDWKQLVKKLQGQGYPIEYRRGQVAEKILHPRLHQLMRPLKKGEASQLTFIEGTAYTVRIVDEKHIAPRPLNEVSAEIRKTLLPIQLKKAIKKASKEVLKKAEVVYGK